MKRNFTLEYWLDEGWYVGRLKKVPGVFSQGETLPELMKNVRDAYGLMTDSEASSLEIELNVRRKGSGSGQKWSEVKHLAHRRCYELTEIKKWRAAERAAGRLYGLDDYFKLHGICTVCQSLGLQMTGWDEMDQVPLWAVCSFCGGSGRAQPSG